MRTDRWFDQDGKIIHHRRVIVDEDRAKRLREAPQQPVSDSWHVATIPGVLIDIWLKEAGVRWDDTEARNQVIDRHLMSGDYSKLRVREGRF